LLKNAEKAKPGPKPKQLIPTVGTNSKKKMQAKAGVSKKQAENWQKLAAVPEEQFEAGA